MDNYKIGIISDTHSLLRPEVTQILETCDIILHAGDLCQSVDLENLRAIAPTVAVRGNNDLGRWASILKYKEYFKIGNIKFFMTHDKYDIPHDLKDVDVIIYGHSHLYDYEEKNGVIWLNPGSCGRRRFNYPITMAVMNISHGKMDIERIDFQV